MQHTLVPQAAAGFMPSMYRFGVKPAFQYRAGGA